MPEVIERSGGSGYGHSGWKPGQTIRNEDFGIGRGEPEYLTVLEAEQQYIRYDGMSFGVGDESGYVYWARCRPATDAEAAPLVAARAADMARRAARTRLDEIKRTIRDWANFAPGTELIPEGDRLLNTENAHGGGDWLVVGREWIWYVKNNGADGDDWALNNVRTGGAGAIGWRVPATVELADELRRLAVIGAARR